MYPNLQYLAVHEVVEEHRASNGNAGELEECLQDVRHGDLHGKVKDWMDQILQLEPPAIRGTWAPLVSM